MHQNPCSRCRGALRVSVARETAGSASRLSMSVAFCLLVLGLLGGAAAAQEDDPEIERPEGFGLQQVTGPPEGPTYTWRDGDRTMTAWLQEDLTMPRDAVTGDGVVMATAAEGMIVARSSSSVGGASAPDGYPVFRSSSGTLMTLPGGVLIVFVEEWSQAQVDGFFAAQGIAVDRLSPLGAIPNGFVIETEPGFPALELANTLADREGVRLSSPNWWREVVPK